MARHLDYPDIPFHAFLQETAARHGDRPAIVFQDRTLTFADWDRRANQCAHALREAGVQHGDRVGLFLPNCPEYEIAFFGCARLGAVPTPLNPSYREREVRHQLKDAEAAVLITHQSLAGVVQPVRGELPALRHVVTAGDEPFPGSVLFDRMLEGQPDSPPDASIGPDDLAALPYSSGTTGLSKGVMLTQRNLVCNTLQFVDATQTTADDTLLIFLPLYHIYGVALLAMSAATGARQILLPRFDLAEVVRLIEGEAVTELYVVPPVMLALANAEGLQPDQFRSVRFVMSAAAPLAIDVARRVQYRLGVRIIQAYGMTESSPLTHMVPLDLPAVTEHVGVVAADTECKIVDVETGTVERGPGEVGEVVVRGPQVMAGYWHAPAATSEALRDGWLHTGDIGSVDAAGNLSILDRKKEMIKYKAFSIAPAELEAVLLEHPAVVDCGVTAMPDEEAGEAPYGFVVLRPGMSASPDELQRFVAERVAGYKQIRKVEIVDAIPRTPSGKILRRVLKERVGAVENEGEMR